MKIALLASVLLMSWFQASAQPGNFRFQPPPPRPPSPEDFYDDDEIDMGDDGFRPPPPPPPPPTTDYSPPPMDTSPTPAPSRRSQLGDDKVRFELVEGEYWEKGKKRARGEKLRAKTN